MKLVELVEYLDRLLEPAKFRDYCPYGLQVEGRAEVREPGSLADEALRLDQLVAVYQRGLAEVAQLIEGVETTPG